MKTMSSTKEQDLDKKLKAFHRRSSRHVLVLETNMSHKDKCNVFHYADLIRKAGNELVAIMNNHLKQLCKTKKYKQLKSLYAKSYKAKDHAKCKQIASQLNELYEKYNLTNRYCEKAMIPIGKKYNIQYLHLLKQKMFGRALKNAYPQKEELYASLNIMNYL